MKNHLTRSGSLLMDKYKFAQLMNYLYVAYKRDPDKAEMNIFYDILGIYSFDQVEKAVRDHVAESSFFPRVADIKKRIQATQVTVDVVLSEIRKVISISMGRSWSRKDIHPVSYNILKELGGKMSAGQLSDQELEKKVKMKFNYVVDAELTRLGMKETPQVESRRSGGSQQLGNLLSGVVK